MAQTVRINGEDHELSAGTTLEAALSLFGIEPSTGGVAVAIDGDVILRSEWSERTLCDGEEVEIVRAVQGG